MKIANWGVFVGILICCGQVSGDCGSPPMVENASSNTTGTTVYPDGTVLRYDCDMGYTTSGTSRYFTCSLTKWTGGNIYCDEIFCSYIPPPANGKYANTPTLQVGTVVSFSCNEGHVMSGVKTLLCRVNGEWIPPEAPTCTPRDCGEFGSVQNGVGFQDNSQYERNHYGSVIVVTCNSGYILNGSPKVKCQADGTWGPKPTCQKTTCQPYPNTNSSCISNVVPFGSYIMILCTEGENISVTQVGDNMVQCLPSGQWDRLDVACHCDCFIGPNLDTVNFKNLNSKLFLSHDQPLQWECISGRKLSETLVQCTDGVLSITVNGSDVNLLNSNSGELADQYLCRSIRTTQKSETNKSPENTAYVETTMTTGDSVTAVTGNHAMTGNHAVTGNHIVTADLDVTGDHAVTIFTEKAESSADHIHLFLRLFAFSTLSYLFS